MRKFRAFIVLATVAASMSALAAPAGAFSVDVRGADDVLVASQISDNTSFTIEGLEVGRYEAVFTRLDTDGVIIVGSTYRQAFTVAPEDQPQTIMYDKPGSATITVAAYDVPEG